MQQRTRLAHSGFTSTENRPRRGRRRGKRRAPTADSMLIKFGACAFVCALALLVQAAKEQPRIVAASTAAEEERYGRLTFVELPGIIEVFAPSQQAAFKLSCSKQYYDEASLSLTLTSAGAQAVPAAIAGRVKSVSEEGGAVSVALDGDRELCFSGLSQVSVEEGQRLGALDTVGSVTADAVLTITAREGGRPLDPRTLLRLEDGAAA